jgi:hypothetical protein
LKIEQQTNAEKRKKEGVAEKCFDDQLWPLQAPPQSYNLTTMIVANFFSLILPDPLRAH